MYMWDEGEVKKKKMGSQEFQHNTQPLVVPIAE